MAIVLPDLLTQSYDNYAKDSTNLEMFLSELEDNTFIEQFNESMQLDYFDPNTVTKDQLIQMNLPKNVVENLVKYRNKGGYFYKNDEFKKIYGLTDSVYSTIEPYLQIEGKEKSPTKRTEKITKANEKQVDEWFEAINESSEKVRKESLTFDLNLADTLALKSVYGVGEVLSVRIIKYRQALGGFVNKQQLGEVYGLAPEVIESIHGMSFITEQFEPEKIKINFASVTDLRRHPYLDYEDAVNIVDYRSKNGPFKDLDKLRESKLLDSVKLNKVYPYFSF